MVQAEAVDDDLLLPLVETIQNPPDFRYPLILRLLLFVPGDGEVGKTFEFVDESDTWLMYNCETKDACDEEEAWGCTEPPASVMPTGSIDGDTLKMDAGFENSPSHWEFTPAADGTLRGTRTEPDCTGDDCDWATMACNVDAGYIPICDGPAEAGLVNCYCGETTC